MTTNEESLIIREIAREIVPYSNLGVGDVGRMIVRAAFRDYSLALLDMLYEIMEKDALTCKPPLEIDRGKAKVVQYGEPPGPKTYGLEYEIPAGHEPPEGYITLPTPQDSL